MKVKRKRLFDMLKPHFQYKQKLMLIILCVLLVPLTLILSIGISWMWKQQVDHILNTSISELDAGVERVNNLYLGSLYKIEHIKYNTVIRGIMNKNYEGRYDELFADLLNIKYIIAALNPEAASNDKLYMINIFVFNDTIMSSDYIKNANAVDEAGSLDPAIKEEVQHSKANVPIWKYVLKDEKGTVSIQRESVCLYEQMAEVDRPLAIIEIKISMSWIKKELGFSIPSGSFLVYSDGNDNNIIISSNGVSGDKISAITNSLESSEKFRSLEKSPEYYCIPKSFIISNHKAVLFIDRSYITERMTVFTLLLGFTVILLVATLVIIVRVISYFLTRRLSNLIVNINIDDETKPENGGIIQLKGDDEFAVINTRFLELVHKIRDYYGEISRLEMGKKIMEVELLQAGINPHFLYNTLSAIKWAYEDERLSGVIDSMVKYYRIMLNQGNMVLKLEQELDMIREYLEIQKFAYRKEFSYRIHVDDHIRKCLILKSLLQPVVENAFLHGINSLVSDGILVIEGHLDRGSMILSVSDNGVGMSEDKLEKVLKGESEKMYGGYGLFNVSNRIGAYYGNEYGMVVTSVLDRGTSVRLTLPCIYE